MTPEAKESCNKFLTEKFFGKCWHEWIENQKNRSISCEKCGGIVSSTYQTFRLQEDYFTWPGFGLVWEKWAKFLGWKEPK